MPIGRKDGDRRGRSRFEIVGQLWGSVETVQPLRLRNLSREGALLESPVPLAPDTVQRLRFATPDGQVSDLQARVCHQRPAPRTVPAGRFLVGVEFLGVPAGVQRAIDRIVGGPERA